MSLLLRTGNPSRDIRIGAVLGSKRTIDIISMTQTKEKEEINENMRSSVGLREFQQRKIGFYVESLNKGDFVFSRQVAHIYDLYVETYKKRCIGVVAHKFGISKDTAITLNTIGRFFVKGDPDYLPNLYEMVLQRSFLDWGDLATLFRQNKIEEMKRKIRAGWVQEKGRIQKSKP